MKSKAILLMQLLLVCSFNTVYAGKKYLSPKDFGLNDATNGVERYEALLRCHQQAQKEGDWISYQGIDSIYVEIPKNATGIPLTDRTDFCGVTITVKNRSRDMFLFTMERELQSISLSAQQIDSGDLRNCNTLASGLYIVVVEDKNPWVEERIGYGYPHIRYDILLVKDGKAKNRVVMPYNNENSIPASTFRRVTADEKFFGNLRFIRTSDCTKITGLLRVTGEHNLKLKNLYVYTPQSCDMYGDRVIVVSNSTCVSYEDVIVDGTYSQPDKFGYAFSLNNVWKHSAKRVKASGNWGVYGTNNMSGTIIENCKINRFDIHCYGRDVTIKNCDFEGYYNSFGSTFGTVKFEKCQFVNFVPYLNSGSYNTFVQVDVVFNKCSFILTDQNNFLIQMMGMRADVNRRKELADKHIPNIKIKNCDVTVPDNLGDWYILKLGRYNRNLEVEGANKIDILNLSIKGNTSSTVHLQTDKIDMKKPFDVRERGIRNGRQKDSVKQDCFWPLTKRETVGIATIFVVVIEVVGMAGKYNLLS